MMRAIVVIVVEGEQRGAPFVCDAAAARSKASVLAALVAAFASSARSANRPAGRLIAEQCGQGLLGEGRTGVVRHVFAVAAEKAAPRGGPIGRRRSLERLAIGNPRRYRVALAEPRLPEAVRRTGVAVATNTSTC
ncbi:MAG: hypothetical protein AAF371_14485 [Pseudomonadota bacterium]